jgi:hypothetical protein
MYKGIVKNENIEMNENGNIPFRSFLAFSLALLYNVRACILLLPCAQLSALLLSAL